MLRLLLSILALWLIAPAQAAFVQTTALVQAKTPPNERVTYIHTDALGSPILGTDAQGNVVWQEDYQPYGERFLGVTPPSQRLYTGKYAETRSGLVDYGGRWYNPEIGRFYSVDPQGFDAANPHSFNRYAYANNNPYRYVDPDGEAGLDIVKLGPAAGASFGALAAYTQGQLTGDAALVNASVAGMSAMIGSNAEALASLAPIPGAARVVMNAVKEPGTGRNTSRAFDTGGPTTTRPASFPQNSSQIQHIFRDTLGHLRDTPANRQLLQGVANDSRTTLGTDRFGNVWSARNQADGTQVWVQTRNGIIQNGGLNQTPRVFNPQTGLSGP